MGYTHYWERLTIAHNDETWTKFVCDCITLKDQFILDFIQLGDSIGELPDPIFDNKEICFNGLDADAHETFMLTKIPTEGQSKNTLKLEFGFCKTARKPYDIMVCACLIMYKHYFPDEVWISSDGDIVEGEWKEAFEFVTDVLPTGKEIVFPLLLDEGIFAKHPAKHPKI